MPWRSLGGSDTARAAAMAIAQTAANVVALVFTVIFARVLGADGYGSLAVLISAFIILMVPGSALQVAVSRELSTGLARGDTGVGSAVRRWLTRLALLGVGVALVAAVSREALAALLNVDQAWGAASVPVAAVIWAMVCVVRGALLGFEAYAVVGGSIVAESVARVVFALVLVGAGLDVTGAFVGHAVALAAVGAALMVPLGRRLPHAGAARVTHKLRELLAGARVPVAALILLFGLQELHVIVVKHEVPGDAAGSYAVAAVAAKAIVWVAVGLGLYLLPETARRSAAGVDARPILARTLGLIAICSVPALVIFAALGRPLLEVVFGEDLAESSSALPWLGLAMAFLACSYLCVQFLLGLRRAGFIAVLAVGVVAEVILLAQVGDDLELVAMVLAALQLCCAVVLVLLAFTAGRGAR